MRRFLPKIASPRRTLTTRKERYGHWIFCGLICAIAGSALLSLGLHQKRLSTFRADRVAMRRKELDSWCEAESGSLKRVSRRCTTLDLTMRLRPIGDGGAEQLLDALRGPRYAKPEQRKLRRLLLAHQDITSHGARRVAQLISSCADEEEACALDLSKRFEVDLRRNPIGKRGVALLREAVARARARDFRVIVFVGGKISEWSTHPTVKLGPIELVLGGPRPELEYLEYAHTEFRIPYTYLDWLSPNYKTTTFRIRAFIAVLAFVCGILAGRIGVPMPRLPITIVWDEQSVTYKTGRKMRQKFQNVVAKLIDEGSPAPRHEKTY